MNLTCQYLLESDRQCGREATNAVVIDEGVYYLYCPEHVTAVEVEGALQGRPVDIQDL